jgi:hypothetical protein
LLKGVMRADAITTAFSTFLQEQTAFNPFQARGGTAFSQERVEQSQVDSTPNIPPSVTIWSQTRDAS